MPIRKKGHCRFTVRGREFVWWSSEEKYLKVASADKKFAVTYVLVLESEQCPLLAVSGFEFPGISRQEKRPVWIVSPEYSGSSFGEFAATLVNWCLYENRDIVRYDGPLPPYVGRL